MKASIVDLRYKMSDVLKALDRNEEITILYRGTARGKIIPLEEKVSELKVNQHPFFGSVNDSNNSVSEMMEKVRSARY